LQIVRKFLREGDEMAKKVTAKVNLNTIVSVSQPTDDSDNGIDFNADEFDLYISIECEDPRVLATTFITKETASDGSELQVTYTDGDINVRCNGVFNLGEQPRNVLKIISEKTATIKVDSIYSADEYWHVIDGEELSSAEIELTVVNE